MCAVRVAWATVMTPDRRAATEELWKRAAPNGVNRKSRLMAPSWCENARLFARELRVWRGRDMTVISTFEYIGSDVSDCKMFLTRLFVFLFSFSSNDALVRFFKYTFRGVQLSIYGDWTVYCRVHTWRLLREPVCSQSIYYFNYLEIYYIWIENL